MHHHAPALLRGLLLAAAVGVAMPTPAQTAQVQAAQIEEISRGDPMRWYQDDTTLAERLRTLRKETAAALQENLMQCRALSAPERSACVREARRIYQREMASARSRAMTAG
ncbi:MAG: hypothetical protein V4484_22455 [Pseudomonadota bacterium]